MLDRIEGIAGAPKPEHSAPRAVTRFLGEGIPLGLTAAAATEYMQQCQALLDLLETTESLVAIKLRAAQIIAPSALWSAQSDLDAVVLSARDLQRSAEAEGGKLARAYALAAWAMTHPGPEHTARRIETANEILDIATEHDEFALTPIGYALLLTGLLERGEIRSLDIELLERRSAAGSLILPFADHLVPVGIGVSFWGTAARTLGLLEESLGMLDEARSHLELAIEMSSRIGALAWHAEAQIELAEFGIRNEISDFPSYTLLAEARATAEARGFTMLAHRSMPPPRIRVLGRFEVTSLCGKRAEWSSRRARELLKMATAKRLYRGPAFSDEPYADWAIEAREHAEHVRQLLD